MGISSFPPAVAASGGIKSVQRGSAGGSGNVTITAVDISKSFVTVFGTTSSGTVAASGAINATNMSSSQGFPVSSVGNDNTALYPSGAGVQGGGFQGWCGANSKNNASQWNITRNYTANSTNLSGGSNNLVAAVVQGYLSNSTTLVVSGACRWEVVEFN